MLTIRQTVILLVILILLYILTLPSMYKIRETIANIYDNGPTEVFGDFWYRPYGYNMHRGYPFHYRTHTNFPFWNMQLGTTRNMSYDLRGDMPIHRTPTGPWLQSSVTPIKNKPLWMVS